MSYDVSSLDNEHVVELSDNVGFIYFTNDTLTNPWDSLPPYLEEIAKVLDSIEPSSQQPIGLDVGTAEIPLDSSIIDAVNPWLN